MYYITFAHIARWLSNALFLCLSMLCALSCANGKSDDSRTPSEMALFLHTNDSTLRLDARAPQTCDSLMAAASDSLTYYDYYILKGRYYLLTEHPDSALPFARNTLAFANSRPATPRTLGLKALAKSTEASFYHLLRLDPQRAISLNLQAYELILTSDLNYYSPEIAANLADSYIAADDLPAGAKWYRRALFLVDSLNLPKEKNITLYMGLGQIYTTMNDYASAKHYYEMSERHYSLMKPNMQSYFLNNFGNYYYYKGDYSNALATFRKLKRHLETHNAEDTYDMYLCLVNMADIFLNLDLTDSAQAYVDKAAGYFAANDIKPGIYYANTIRIGIAAKQGRHGDIERILKEEPAFEGYNQSIRNIRSKYLQEYYTATGNYKKAYSDLLLNIAQNDSLEHNRTYMKAAEIMMRYTEDTLKLHHLLEINAKNAEVSKSKATLWLLISIAVALASILVSGTIAFRKRKVQLKMQAMKLRLNNARQRISPHFVFNVLNTRIGSASIGETDALLRLAKLIRSSLDMTGKPFVTLREELDFITEYISLERAFIGDDFEFRLTAPDEKTQGEVRLPAMFIQILVENAIKHGLKCVAGHKRLEVSIACSDGGINIDVTDNGPGFDIRHHDYGRTKNGLSIIRQTISIVNQENRGGEKMHFCIQNMEDANGNVCGCKASLKIPQTIKFI